RRPSPPRSFILVHLHAPSPSELYTLSLHDALPILLTEMWFDRAEAELIEAAQAGDRSAFAELLRPVYDTALRLSGALLLDADERSEEHTSELQSRVDLVCRLLLEKKKQKLDCVAEE